jgi:hypothetical protein
MQHGTHDCGAHPGKMSKTGRFGQRELAYTTSYMETNNSSEGQPTLSSNQERLSIRNAKKKIGRFV